MPLACIQPFTAGFRQLLVNLKSLMFYKPSDRMYNPTWNFVVHELTELEETAMLEGGVPEKNKWT